MTAPRRIEWSGPERWSVWADEDGVHLRTPGGDALEMPDVERLFALWQHARAMVATGHVDAPKPMTREEAREQLADHREEYTMRRAVRAVQREFGQDEAPF